MSDLSQAPASEQPAAGVISNATALAALRVAFLNQDWQREPLQRAFPENSINPQFWVEPFSETSAEASLDHIVTNEQIIFPRGCSLLHPAEG